jgi:anti-sigma regulatory factor (Ser/Thr protein kinase)
MIARVADPSEVSAARRAATDLARASGFDETATGRIAIVATEMATNLLKHASAGEIIVGNFADRDGAGLELLALDKGPGIADLGVALADGYSTAGSPGTGLGAVRRQCDQFAIWSRPGLGTAAVARFQRHGPSGSVALGAIVEPYPGETVAGDGWAFGAAASGPTLLMVDGSGHGPLATRAAEAATKAFQGNLDRECKRLMEDIHRGLAPTRGAAVAVARVDMAQRLVRFIGVGNISAALHSQGVVRRMVTHNGTAGHIAPRMQEFTYPWTGNATIILHSDGLSAKWDLDAYPGLATSHPSLIAGVLFRDYRRGRDDASIVVMRVAP